MYDNSAKAELYELFAALTLLAYAVGGLVGLQIAALEAVGLAILFSIWAVRIQIAKEQS
jgi:hypothetical protein